jgi:hypothetical protein
MGRSAAESKIQDSALSSEPNTELRLPQGKAIENLTGSGRKMRWRFDGIRVLAGDLPGQELYLSRVGPVHCPPRSALS